MLIASWLSALGFLLPWITSSRYPQKGCSYLPASAASLLKGGKPILSDPFETGTLLLTIIGETMVVLYCYFKIFWRVQISVKRISILHFPIMNNLPCSLPRKDKRLGFYVLAVCFIFILTTEPLFWVLLTALFTMVPLALSAENHPWTCPIFVTNPFLYTWKNEEFRKDPCSRENFGEGLQLGLSPSQLIQYLTFCRDKTVEGHFWLR